jgi:alkaline phosphatase
MFLENIIPPIPSEIIMPLGGFFVYQQKLNFYILVFWGRLVPGIRTLISVLRN